jgi:predicted ester cyclase
MLTEDEMRAVWDRFIEAEEGKIPFDDTFVDPGLVLHFRNGVFAAGLDGLKEQFAAFRAAFPELRHTVEDVFVSGDKLASRVKIDSGPHSGVPLDIFTAETKGRSFVADEIVIVRFENGRITEQWSIPDALSIIDDVGLKLVNK